PTAVVRPPDIHLDDFGACSFARVGYRDGKRKAALLRYDGIAGIGLSDGKAGIAQTESKREKRIVHKPISPAVHRIAFKILQLCGALIKGDRQLARGIVVAEKNVCHGLTARLTSVPGLKDRVAVVRHRRQCNGRPGTIHEDDLFTGSL